MYWLVGTELKKKGTFDLHDFFTDTHSIPFLNFKVLLVLLQSTIKNTLGFYDICGCLVLRTVAKREGIFS